MQSGRPSQTPRRRYDRALTHVTVRWHNRAEEAVAAVVYDVSPEGVFLVPEGHVPDSVGTGDNVWVVVPSEHGSETLTGTIRWRGYHPRHNLIGFGIRVEGPSVKQLERAFASTLRPPKP